MKLQRKWNTTVRYNGYARALTCMYMCACACVRTRVHIRDRYMLDNHPNWQNRALYLTGYPLSVSVGSDRDAFFSRLEKKFWRYIRSREALASIISIGLLEPQPRRTYPPFGREFKSKNSPDTERHRPWQPSGKYSIVSCSESFQLCEYYYSNSLRSSVRSCCKKEGLHSYESLGSILKDEIWRELKFRN